MGCLSIAVLSVLCSTVAAQVDDQSGKNPNQLTHGAIFNRVIFATQGRQCVTVSLESVGDTSVTVKLSNGPWPQDGSSHSGTIKTLQRSDLLRVTYLTMPFSVFFSGRSSWLDVNVLLGKPHRFIAMVRVEASAGQKYEGFLRDTSNEGLTLWSSGRSIPLRKLDIAKVSRIIQVPSDSAILTYDNPV
jgi:hypothetical protein